MPLASRFLAFDDFRLNVAARELLRVGKDGSPTPISLGSRAADLLLLFLQRPGELVTKNEIMDAVWPNAVVEESNLTVQISTLRRVLDAGRSGASSIQTVPGRGYRFTLRVMESDEAVTDPPISVSGTSAPARVEPSSELTSASPETTLAMLEDKSLPPPAPMGRATSWRPIGVGVALCASIVIVLWTGFFKENAREPAAVSPVERSVAPTVSTSKIPLVAPTARNIFDTTNIPLVTDDARRALAGFRNLPDAKAIAISRDGWGMASSNSNLDAAKEEALQRCATLAKLTNPTPGPCALFAVGSEIVWPEEKLRLPWPADIHAVPLDIPFVAADLPTIPDYRRLRLVIDKKYPAAAGHKALALGQERFFFASAKTSEAEAVRLTVERCADFAQAPCLLVAVDGFFTVQLPKLRQVTQLFMLASETAIPEAERQRIATIYQRSDWRALARGSGGTWHAVAGATSEAVAIEQAMKLCAARDQGCRIYAIGNFRVADEN
jgi:DNA-binding winged helix-turn-helix (wHTH) protein